jgi:predicted RNA-binding protein associated with RNAse of E/G family
VLTDHYLDIVVRTGRDAAVLDVDEFVAAVALGLLAPAAAESAMHTAYRAVDGIASHGHDLDAWLATFGIALTWKERGGVREDPG